MINDLLSPNVQTLDGFITSSFVLKIRCEWIHAKICKRWCIDVLGQNNFLVYRKRLMLHDCFPHSTQSDTIRIVTFNITSTFISKITQLFKRSTKRNSKQESVVSWPLCLSLWLNSVVLWNSRKSLKDILGVNNYKYTNSRKLFSPILRQIHWGV